jgi:hypothetical protein
MGGGHGSSQERKGWGRGGERAGGAAVGRRKAWRGARGLLLGGSGSATRFGTCCSV